MVKRRFKRTFKRRYRRRTAYRRRPRRTSRRRFTKRLRVRKTFSLRQPLKEIVRLRWTVNANRIAVDVPIVPSGGPTQTVLILRPHSIYDPDYTGGLNQASVQRYSEYEAKYRGMRVLGVKANLQIYFPELTSVDATDSEVILWTHPFYYDDYAALPNMPDFRSYLGSPWLTYKKTTFADCMSKDLRIKFTYKRKQFKMDNTDISYEAVNVTNYTVLYPIFLQITGPISGTEHYPFPGVLLDGYVDYLTQFNNPKTEALAVGT